MKEQEKSIIYAAITLFSEEGLGVTTAQIAKQAEISEDVLSKHFATKQDVIDGVYFFIKEHISNETIGRDNHGKDARNKSMNIWQYYMAWAQENPLEYNVTNLLDVSKAASHDVIVASDHFFACIHECMEKSIEEKVIRDAPIAYLFSVAEKHLNVAVAFAKNNNMTGEALKKHIASSFDIYWNGIKA